MTHVRVISKNSSEIERFVTEFLQHHPHIKVTQVVQSSAVIDQRLWITISIFYTEQ